MFPMEEVVPQQLLYLYQRYYNPPHNAFRPKQLCRLSEEERDIQLSYRKASLSYHKSPSPKSGLNWCPFGAQLVQNSKICNICNI